MRKLSRALTIVLPSLFAVLLLCSCETIASWFVTKPKVSLDHVALQSADANGATVVFAVLVENPNSFSLKVDAIHYHAEIAGHPLTAGTLENLATVPAHDKAVVEIPISVKFSDIFSSILDIVTQSSTPYHVAGEATFGFISVPFDQSGEFKIKP